MYRKAGDDIAVFASKAGAPTNPDWYHNLVAHPDVTAEIGTETVPLTARVAKGDERTAIWEAQKKEFPGFAEYEEKGTARSPSSSSPARPEAPPVGEITIFMPPGR